MTITLPPAGAESAMQLLMRSVARRARALAPGGDGAGTALLLGNRWVFDGSNAFTRAVDRLQYRLGEGPCLSAVADDVMVRSTSIGAGEQRWPTFTSQASELALRSVASAPIVVRAEVIGSLNLYSKATDGFDALSPAALRRAAHAAGTLLDVPRLLALAEAAARALADAVQDRAEVDLAVGLLMDRYTMTAGQAEVLVGQLARHDGVGEAAAARSLLDQGGSR